MGQNARCEKRLHNFFSNPVNATAALTSTKFDNDCRHYFMSHSDNLDA